MQESRPGENFRTPPRHHPLRGEAAARGRDRDLPVAQPAWYVRLDCAMMYIVVVSKVSVSHWQGPG